MLNNFPKYFTGRAMAVYFAVLVTVSMLYLNQLMDVEWFLTGIVSVVCFFHFSNTLPRKWANYSVKKFEKKIFWNTIILRLIWVLCFYAFTMRVWDTPWEMPIGSSLDSPGYFGDGEWIAEAIKEGEFQAFWNYGARDDLGYRFIMAILIILTNGSILLSRLFNILFDAWAVVLLYRLAARNFGENVGRLAGIFVMIMPLMFYYTGITMKESLMGMLCIWFVERADLMFRERDFSFVKVVVVLLLAGCLFFFRTALGMVTIMSLLAAVVFTSGMVVGWKKKIMVGFFVISIIGVFMGGYIMQKAEELQQQREFTEQHNLEFRAKREGGNAFARNLSTAVFAPVIFTVPFPTMVDVPGQPIQQMLNGANYIKNIMSFFCLLAIFILIKGKYPKFSLLLLIKNKQWREHVLPLAFMCGYLAAVGLSNFAHSGRFHMPVVPFQLMFAAFAICNISKKQAEWFNYFLVFEFVAIVFWTWFKLAGRGMV
jgi:hypothetical protein